MCGRQTIIRKDHISKFTIRHKLLAFICTDEKYFIDEISFSQGKCPLGEATFLIVFLFWRFFCVCVCGF